VPRTPRALSSARPRNLAFNFHRPRGGPARSINVKWIETLANERWFVSSHHMRFKDAGAE
jgi:hypothetical protein